MPRVDAIVFCGSHTRDEKGYLSLNQTFHTLMVLGTPLRATFDIAVMLSDLPTGAPVRVILDVFAPSRFEALNRNEKHISSAPTQYAELVFQTADWLLPGAGVYRADVRFSEDSPAAHSATFEVVPVDLEQSRPH